MSFVATLIAGEGDLLSEARATELAVALGGHSISWLNANRACDVMLDTAPEQAEEIWSEAQANRIDLAIQPAVNRRKKLLIADMDSTMIQQECIDELAAEAGIGARVADITARAMNGELDFEAAMKERVGLLAGLDTGAIARVLETRISYMPGGTTLLATMKSDGAHSALVSGGFTDFTSAVANYLGFDENRANILHQKDGKLTGTVAEPILGRDAKVQALKEITSRLGLTSADAIAVGDGANDLGMLNAAGTGVALHAKPSVAAQSKIKLNFADLTGLLYLQGYGAEDFVTA